MPTELFDKTRSLETLNLYNTSLSGTLPTYFATLGSLRKLYIPRSLTQYLRAKYCRQELHLPMRFNYFWDLAAAAIDGRSQVSSCPRSCLRRPLECEVILLHFDPTLIHYCPYFSPTSSCLSLPSQVCSNPYSVDEAFPVLKEEPLAPALGILQPPPPPSPMPPGEWKPHDVSIGLHERRPSPLRCRRCPHLSHQHNQENHMCRWWKQSFT